MTRILVVEDGIYLRDLYKQILEAEKYLVETASDGQEALSMLNNGGYDLVLLDIKLPKINGLDVLKTIRSNPPQKPNGLYVFLTCADDKQSISQGLALGARKYLIKSEYTPGQIVDEVKQILSEERLQL